MLEKNNGKKTVCYNYRVEYYHQLTSWAIQNSLDVKNSDVWRLPRDETVTPELSCSMEKSVRAQFYPSCILFKSDILLPLKTKSFFQWKRSGKCKLLLCRDGCVILSMSRTLNLRKSSQGHLFSKVSLQQKKMSSLNFQSETFYSFHIEQAYWLTCMGNYLKIMIRLTAEVCEFYAIHRVSVWTHSKGYSLKENESI